MSEKQLQDFKTKMRTRGFRMDFPFSKFTGFLVCMEDPITEEKRCYPVPRWSDAYALYHLASKTTKVEIWNVESGQIKRLVAENYDENGNIVQKVAWII